MIYHITSKDDWYRAQVDGVYKSPSLKTDGFIHCSTQNQVIDVANELFCGKRGLVLLCIDPASVASRIVYEDLYETKQLFPHIYGDINLESVVEILDFTPEPDGKFVLPPEIR